MIVQIQPDNFLLHSYVLYLYTADLVCGPDKRYESPILECSGRPSLKRKVVKAKKKQKSVLLPLGTHTKPNFAHFQTLSRLWLHPTSLRGHYPLFLLSFLVFHTSFLVSSTFTLTGCFPKLLHSIYHDFWKYSQ